MQSGRTVAKGSLWVLVISLMLIVSCAPKARKAVGIMDTPEHHYNQGISFLDNDQPGEAATEFDLALGLDEGYGPALAGKGLVAVIQGNDEGLKMITKAWRKASGDWEKEQVVTAEIRAYIAMKKNGHIGEREMIRKAKESFAKGLRINRDAPALYFYMGQAYLQGLDFKESEAMFAMAKSLGGDFEERAYERWTFVQKANRAAPESMVGKKIALVERLSRADMAALLIEELNIERFYNRTQEAEEVSFEAPSGISMQGDELYEKKLVSDIDDHPLKNDIEKAITLGVEGLTPYPDHSFKPQAPISRVEAAQLFQDLIVRATGKTALATEYIGETSRIPDVPTDHWGFNAVRLCTERGIMSTDIRSNAFSPKEVMSGVDALLAMKELKRALTVF